MNLTEEFTKRCLFRAINFLNNINYPMQSFNLSNDDILNITNFNIRNYHYFSTIKSTTPFSVFLKHYSRILLKNLSNSYKNEINIANSYKHEINQLPFNDAYFLYLKALICKENKIELLIQSLKLNNYFYDAFECLCLNTTVDNFYLVEKSLKETIFDQKLVCVYFVQIYVARLLKAKDLFLYSSFLKEIVDQKNINNKNGTKDRSTLFQMENSINSNTNSTDFYKIHENKSDLCFEEVNPTKLDKNNSDSRKISIVLENSQDQHPDILASKKKSTVSINEIKDSYKTDSADQYSTSKRLKQTHFNEQNSFLKHLLGAFYYSTKEFSLSKHYFETDDILIADYIDLYSHILYINNDVKKSALLAQKLTQTHPLSSETMVCIANYYSLKKNTLKAIEYLEKSIKLDSRARSNYTLLGNEFADLNLTDKSIFAYLDSLKFNKSDYRAFHGIATIKKGLGLDLEANFYYKKCVELNQNDSFFWIEFANSLESIGEIEESISAYKRAYAQGDSEGLLRIGDVFKKQRDYKQSIEFYEKYVEECKAKGKECKKIVDCIEKFYALMKKTRKSQK